MKKVIFDTSFLIDSQKYISNERGVNIIDSEFPINEYERFIHDCSIDEFFKNSDFLEKNILFCRDADLGVMDSSHMIIKEEFIKGTSYKLQRNFCVDLEALVFLQKQHPAQKEKEVQHQISQKDRERGRQEVYDRISQPGTETDFSLEEIAKLF